MHHSTTAGAVTTSATKGCVSQQHHWCIYHTSYQCPCSTTPPGFLPLRLPDWLGGLVVKVSASRAEDQGFASHLQWDFCRSRCTSGLEIGTPVATLPGAWRYRISAGTCWPSVSILWLGEVESWICNFHLSVAAHKIVWADPSLRYNGMLLGR